MTVARLRKAERSVANGWTLYEFDAPDGTSWAARPETHPVTGVPAARRYGWAVLEEDRWGGYVIVTTVARLSDVRRCLGDDEWRARNGLHDPKLRATVPA